MILDVIISINAVHVRLAMNHGFFAVTYQTTDIQLPNRHLIIIQCCLGNLDRDRIRGKFDLGKMKFKP